LLGLGVSHIPLVEGVRKYAYGRPLATMRAYLQAMAAAPYQSVPPASPPKTVLAALGPKMLALSAELADGAHPYNVTPEHTRQARVLLGAGKLLCDEKAIRARIDEHWQAGADHVCVQAIGPTVEPDEHLLALLAPGP
jgi:hypothetical protein